MDRRSSGRLRRAEGGYALIEVIVSALIVLLTTAGVVRTLTATGHASTEERHLSQAYALAQEDQARMRGVRIADLQQGTTTRTVTLNSVPFTVTSTATFVSNKTGSSTCGSEGNADYVRIGSKITWPSRRATAPVELESIDTPVSGSVDPTAGGLAIEVHGANPEMAFSGWGIKGTGPQPFSGTTNSEGCAVFGGLPAGEYTLTFTPGSSGWIKNDGTALKPISRSVVGGTTTSEELEYDIAGGFEAIKFSARNANGTTYYAKADSVILVPPEASPRVLGTPGGTAVPSFAGPGEKTYFPFYEAPYSITAGSCTNEYESGEASAEVPRGGLSPPVLLKLPVLYITVKNSAGSATEKEGLGAAKVTLTSLTCKNPATGKYVERTYTTTTAKSLTAPRIGALALESATTEEAPGVPADEYKLCVSKGGRRLYKEKVLINSTTGALIVEGKALESLPLVLDLGSVSNTGASC